MSSGMRVLVLVDGGFRSAFVAGLAVKECGLHAVKLFYMHDMRSGIIHSRRLKAVSELASYYCVPYTCFHHHDVGGVFSMTSKLFVALSYAHTLGFPVVYYGASKQSENEKQDVSLFNYELTHTHLRNIKLMIKSARYEHRYAELPEPEAPCMLLSPSQIIFLSKSYDVPLDITWNCEEDNLLPCNKCKGCVEWNSLKQRMT